MKNIQKQQFVKIAGIFLFAFMVVICVQGQSYSQSLLINKEWVNRYITDLHTIHFFTDKEIVVKIYHKGKKSDVELISSYYLSEEVVDKFQPDSVGNSKNGKYIVKFRKLKDGSELFELYEILELTEKTLKTKHLRSGSVLEYKVE